MSLIITLTFKTLDIPMGILVYFAGIFMNYVLDRLIKERKIQPKLLVKYVHDILIVIKRSEVDSILKVTSQNCVNV